MLTQDQFNTGIHLALFGTMVCQAVRDVTVIVTPVILIDVPCTAPVVTHRAICNELGMRITSSLIRVLIRMLLSGVMGTGVVLAGQGEALTSVLSRLTSWTRAAWLTTVTSAIRWHTERTVIDLGLVREVVRQRRKDLRSRDVGEGGDNLVGRLPVMVHGGD